MSCLFELLDATERQIRLLTIRLCKETTDLLHCELNTSSLNAESVSYNTLSYRWGDPKDTRPIRVNGHVLEVTSNLHAALLHLRNTADAATTPIWIDAICINQQDVDERNSQVAIMRDIYAQAERVHIWLGDRNALSANAMIAWSELAQAEGTGAFAPWMGRLDETTLEKLQHLTSLADNPYWKRTWILQEIAFAEHVVMHGAGLRVAFSAPSWSPSGALVGPNRNLESLYLNHSKPRFPLGPPRSDSLEDRIDALVERVQDAIFAPILRANWSRTVAGLIEAGEVSFARSINELFLRYRESLATDPRDKVYGLLGIAPGLLNMQPDYLKTTREVYCEATLQLMRCADHLEILNQACSGNTELPSWVPAFSQPCRLSKRLSLPGNSASATLRSLAKYKAVDWYCLCVHALKFDCIVQIKRQHNFDPADIESVWTNWQEWLQYFLQFGGVQPQEACEVVAQLQLHTAWRHGSIEDLTAWLKAFSQSSSSAAPESMIYITEIMQDYDLFYTAAGYFGVAPKGKVDTGYLLVLIAGAQTPFCASDITLPSGQTAIVLRTPCVVDASFPDNVNYPMERVALEDFHVRLMDGGLVVSEAIRKFGDANRIDDVFEEVLIA